MAIVAAAIWSIAGLFVALIWPALLVSITVHEIGHALSAQYLGVKTNRMVIGVGPRIVEGMFGELPVSVRLLPLLGWVEPDLADRPHMSRRALKRSNRRMAVIFAAGPVTSFLLGLTLIIVGNTAAAFNPNLRNPGISESLTMSTHVATSPFGLVADQLGKLAPPYSLGDPPDAAERRHTIDSADETDEQATTIIGFTVQGNSYVSTYGLAMAPIFFGLLNLSLAGFNLLPVWGLDGYGLLSELAESLGGMSRRRAVRVRTLLRMVGALTAMGLAMLLVQAFWHDLVG